MPPIFRVVALQVWLLICGACLASAATLFQDGFESGALGPSWAASGTNDWRATVSADFSPAAGQYHLVLDDGVNDATYSVAQAALRLDLTNKKNVVLTFQAKSLGNEANPPPTGNYSGLATFDGVSISVDGGYTWRAVQSLAAVSTSWQTFSVPLDSFAAALGGYTSGVLIRFSEYDNSPAPIDGIAIDEVAVTGDNDLRVSLELPVSAGEGGGSYRGYALLNVASASAVTVNLSASPSGQLTLPGAVVIPAGQTFASFDFSVVDDNLVNFTRTITLTASSAGYTSGAATLTVYDNEQVQLGLTLPAQLTEGTSPTSNASVSIDRAASAALTVTLAANPASEVSLPSSVTIPASATQAAFTIQAVNDSALDGNLPVTVTASATGVTSATAQTTTIDNEVRSLTLKLASGTLTEGGALTGTATIGGTLTSALTVNLTSSNPSVASVPASVTIPAGATQISFTVSAPDNALRDGSRGVTLSATAGTFPDASAALTVRDNEVGGYRFAGLTDIVNLSSPVSVTVSASDVEGNALVGGNGAVSLSVVLPDGSTQALSPASITISSATGWSGSVTIPAAVGTATPLRLRATDAGGVSSDSAAFDIMRVISLTTGDMLWDATRSRLYASVPAAATSNYANNVVAIDPVTAQITGAVVTANDPGPLALTSGGEQLYVALNGNGGICRITPATLSVNQTFAVGTDSYYGTLYAEDMATVAGQPNLLVISQKRLSVSPRHNGVAVYDNGVIRAKKTQDHTGSNVIEPSADPSIFFGYCNESSEAGFRRLQLDAGGMTEVLNNTTLSTAYASDFRTSGNVAFFNSGAVIDGAQMRKLGSFPVGGPIYPDAAANRVYILEPDSTYSSTYAKLGAYDPNTFSLIRKLALPTSISLSSVYGSVTKSIMRWGVNGLALRTNNAVLLINSNRLVPSDAPANLKVTVQAAPNPVAVGSMLTYTVTVTNQGPNIARNALANVTLSDSQALGNAFASVGTPLVSGLNVSLAIGDLAANASAALTLVAVPQSAGSLSCTAGASSNAVDSDTSDNTSFKLVSVGFQAAVDVVNKLRLSANNLIYDSARALLWASIPATVDAPLGHSVVAIDPTTGLVSDPIGIAADPQSNCMALTANGRYLYVGLKDSPEICRLDLNASPIALVRIPLGINQWNDASYALDIEPLDGDGTSLLVVTNGDDAANVYDGAVRRTNRTGIYTVTRVERTGTSGVFVGYNGADTGFGFSKLNVTSTGVTISQSYGNVISGFGVDLRGAGNLVLTSSGLLLNSGALTLKSNLGVAGRPCLDLPNQRAYLVNGNALRAFDVNTALAAGSLTLPVTATGDWALNCVRWGLDGFAVLGSDNSIYLARWSGAIPATMDSNNNGVSDAWEAANFGSLNVNLRGDSDGDGIPDALEYLFGSSPWQSTASPLRFGGMSANGSGQKTMRLTFPRRADVSASSYGYETSNDMVHWTAAANVAETTLAASMVGGVQMMTVTADVPMPDGAAGFVRLKWLHP